MSSMDIINDDARIPASHITPLGLMPDGVWLGWDEHGSCYARMKDPKPTDQKLVAGLVIAGLVAVRVLGGFMPVVDGGGLRLLLLLFVPCLGLPVGLWYGRRAARRVVWLPYDPPSDRWDAYARRIRRHTPAKHPIRRHVQHVAQRQQIPQGRRRCPALIPRNRGTRHT